MAKINLTQTALRLFSQTREKIKRCAIGEMTVNGRDASFQKFGIAATLQKFFTVIALQEKNIRFQRRAEHFFIQNSRIGDDCDPDAVQKKGKAGRRQSVMKSRERKKLHAAGFKPAQQAKLPPLMQAVQRRTGSDVNRNSVFCADTLHPPHVIGVVMGDQNVFYGSGRLADTLHFFLPAREGVSAVNQKRAVFSFEKTGICRRPAAKNC